MKKKLLSTALSIVMGISLVPITAFGVNEFTVMGPGVEYKGSIIEIVTPGDYEISGTSVSKGIKISVDQGVVNLKLNDANVDLSNVENAVALEITGNSDVNISLKGENNLKSFGNYAGIVKVNSDEKKLVIGGDGSLCLLEGIYTKKHDSVIIDPDHSVMWGSFKDRVLLYISCPSSCFSCAFDVSSIKPTSSQVDSDEELFD